MSPESYFILHTTIEIEVSHASELMVHDTVYEDYGSKKITCNGI